MIQSKPLAILPAVASPNRELIWVPLHSIKRVSQLNPRYAATDDCGSLAASILANGQIQAMLVISEDDGYAVLDGQLRWRAMLLLVEQGHWTPDHSVDVDLRYFEESELREIALAVNIMRRPLHPVEESRSFNALIRAGFDEMRIANDFGIGLWHVRQRLALGRLAPKILDAWFEGLIDADAAKAFTAVENHAAQEAAFENLIASAGGVTSHDVKKLLLSGSMPIDCQEAIYVGADAYVAAGGAINEDLFSANSDFLDGALLQKLAKEKLKADCAAITEIEGWGFFETDGILSDHEIGLVRPDFTDSELARLQELDNGLLTEEVFAERDAIELRGYLRAVPQSRRAELGVFAQLDFTGRPLFTRGLLPQPSKDEPSSARVASRRGRKGAAAQSSQTAAAPISKDFSKPTRAIIDYAVKEAFSQAIVHRPDIAITIITAALGCTFGDQPFAPPFGPPRSVNGNSSYNSHILQKIRTLDFTAALSLCKEAELADISAALTELVASSISAKGKALSIFGPLAAAISSCGAALDEHLIRAFDYEEYFTAVTKKARQDIAVEIDPTFSRAISKKSNSFSVEALSQIAKDHAWLPEPLKSWAVMAGESQDRENHEEEKPLTMAMDEVITADAPARDQPSSRCKKSRSAAPAKKQVKRRKRIVQ